MSRAAMLGEQLEQVVPPNALSYLGGELEDAYRETQRALGQLCYGVREPQP